METLLSRHKLAASRGFTMIEVLIALFMFSVGLVTLSSLAAQALNGTATSRYEGMAATFASAKLEDLNRWPTWDPHVCVASGSTVGSLTSDSQSVSVTCNGVTDTVDYFDDVAIADSSGKVCETVSGSVAGVQNYTVTCHLPDGTMTQSTSTTANAADIGAVAFHRRWTIEMDQPVTGVKRITVLVTLSNGYVKPPVSFQMSAVRP